MESPFFTGPLRSPARLQNTFAHEAFMDESRALLTADRSRIAGATWADPRLKDRAVEEGAKAAKWDARPSPKGAPSAEAVARQRTGIARGRGISFVLYEGDNGYCAMVAEVEVDQDNSVSLVSGASSRRIAGRSRSLMGCGTRSRGGRCRG